jgi:hypothetical protein
MTRPPLAHRRAAAESHVCNRRPDSSYSSRSGASSWPMSPRSELYKARHGTKSLPGDLEADCEPICATRRGALGCTVAAFATLRFVSSQETLRSLVCWRRIDVQRGDWGDTSWASGATCLWRCMFLELSRLQQYKRSNRPPSRVMGIYPCSWPCLPHVTTTLRATVAPSAAPASRQWLQRRRETCVSLPERPRAFDCAFANRDKIVDVPGLGPPSTSGHQRCASAALQHAGSSWHCSPHAASRSTLSPRGLTGGTSVSWPPRYPLSSSRPDEARRSR